MQLRDRLAARDVQEIASALLDLKADEQVLAFRELPRSTASHVFEYLPATAQGQLVKTMGQEDIAALLNHMAPDDRTSAAGLRHTPCAA